MEVAVALLLRFARCCMCSQPVNTDVVMMFVLLLCRGGGVELATLCTPEETDSAAAAAAAVPCRQDCVLYFCGLQLSYGKRPQPGN